MPLSHLRILITGGSRGLGLSIARCFSQHGASTILLSTSESRAASASSSLPTTHPTQTHTYLAGDVSDPNIYSSPIFNDIDVLINSAGITHRSLLVSTPESEVQRVLNTNLLGTILCSRAVVKGMAKRRKGGCIINIASVLGVEKSLAGSSVYAASKAGVVGFTKALAVEIGGRGVRCNVIVPGWIETDMTRGTLSGVPNGMVRTGGEVADAAFFLVKNEGLNGAQIVVDGGYSL